MPCFSGTVLTWKCQGDLAVVPECRGNKGGDKWCVKEEGAGNFAGGGAGVGGAGG